MVNLRALTLAFSVTLPPQPLALRHSILRKQGYFHEFDPHSDRL